MVPYPETLLAFETLSETLADNLQGGLFFATHFTMLIYPAGATAWAFLNDKLPQVPPGAKLRFIVRKPLPQTITMDQELSARLANENPQQYAEIVTRIKAEPIRSGEKHINTVFRDMFEIDYGHLVAQNGPQKYPPSSIFFLCFIPQGSEMYEPETERRLTLRAIISEEHDFFVEFLQANGAAEIYSMQNIGSYDVENNGAWDYFKNNVKSGTIIVGRSLYQRGQIPDI